MASEPIALWDGSPPGTEDWTHERIGPTPHGPGVTIVRNIVEPVLLPAGGDGDVGIVIAPGGAYRFLASEHEGTLVADALLARGTGAATTYVLEYRTVPTAADHAEFLDELAAMIDGRGRRWDDIDPALFADGPQAVRRLRERHERVVMIGSSAGARLTVETMRSSSPPDAAALIYPPYVADLDAAPAGAPPLWTVMAMDDPLTTRGATTIHELWRVAGASSELHLFERGGHGFGTNTTGLPVDRWLDLLADWLLSHDLL